MSAEQVIELAAALIGIVYLFLQYKASPWMWLFSFAMSVMYTFVNFQSRLYANFVLQIIFSIMAVGGLAQWLGIGRGNSKQPITSMPRRFVIPVILVTLALTFAIRYLLETLGETEMPFIDGLTTAINLVGTWMLIKKYYQEWICWIIADPLMAAMYAKAGLWPSAILYAFFTVVVVFGFLHWRHLASQEEENSEVKKD